MQVLHQILQPSRQWYHQPRQATVDAGRCQRQGLVVFNLLLYAAMDALLLQRLPGLSGASDSLTETSTAQGADLVDYVFYSNQMPK